MNEMPQELAEQVEAFLKDPSSGVRRERPESKRDPVVEEFKASLEDDAARNLFDLFMLYVNGVGSSSNEERVYRVDLLANAMKALSRGELHDVLFSALSRLLELELATKELIDATENLVEGIKATE